jgi:hypothetical protein
MFRVLAEHEVKYVLIGGLAAVLHGSPAMTNDVDIVPEHDDENLARLSDALRSLDARLRAESDPDGIAFDPHPALLAQMAIANLTTRCGDLDLTFAPAGLQGYAELVGAAVVFEIEGHAVQVAALHHIIQSKEAADRPRDRAVLPILYALREEIGDDS